MKNKISMLIMIFVVFILVNSVLVSAVNLRGWQWIGLGNEEHYSPTEMNAMYINKHGQLAVGTDKWSEWEVESDSGLVRIYKGTVGGWQYLETDGDKNIKYEEFVQIINKNRNSYGDDNLMRDQVSGVQSSVTTSHDIRTPAAAKTFADEKKVKDEEVKEVKERASTATTAAATAMTEAQNQREIYNYDDAITGLDESIAKLKAAEQEAAAKGMTAEASKLKAQRQKAEKLRNQYDAQRTKDNPVAHTDEYKERTRLAEQIADLDKKIAQAIVDKDIAEKERLRKEKKELEKLKRQDEEILRLLLRKEAAEAAGDDVRAREIEVDIEFKRKAMAQDADRKRKTQETKEKVLDAMDDDERLKEKYFELRKKKKENNLASLQEILDERETEKEAVKDYGINIEGMTFSQVKNEMRKREKMRKEAQEAGLSDDAYANVASSAKEENWDSAKFEHELYFRLATMHDIKTAGKDTKQLKNEIKARRTTTNAYVAEMKKQGVDEDEAKRRLSARIGGRDLDPKAFEAVTKDEVEKEKIKQDIAKFMAAVDASGADDAQKLEYKAGLQDLLNKAGTMNSAELKKKFDDDRVSILSGESAAVAGEISTAYTKAKAPPAAPKAKPAAPKTYLGKLDEDIRKAYLDGDVAKAKKLEAEKKTFEDNYKKYAEELKKVDPAAVPKAMDEFKSSGEFKQEFEMINTRSRAKDMGITPEDTRAKTVAQINQMMDTKSKQIVQSKINGIDPKTQVDKVDLTPAEFAAIRYQAEKGDSQALALLIANNPDEAKKLLDANPDLAKNNPALAEYLANLQAGDVYADEKFNFIKAIRTGKQKEAAKGINTLIKEGKTNILANIGKKGTRYEGWTKVNSWTNPSSGASTALVKDPKTGKYYIVTGASTQRNEDIYRVPEGEFRGADGQRYEHASPHVYYNAYKEGTKITPTPNEQTRQNRVSDLKLIQDGDELYLGKVETDKEVGYVASIGATDAEIGVFMRDSSKEFDGAKVRKDLGAHVEGPFGTSFLSSAGKISLGDEVYVNNDGMVYNKDQNAIESSLYAPDTNNDGAVTSGDRIALGNYDVDLGKNVRLYNTITVDATGKETYQYWACYEVRGQQACEPTDLTSFVPKEFAGDKRGKDLADKIKTRQRWQRAIGTLIRGPTGPGRYYSQRFSNWTYARLGYQEEIDRWMENNWFKPEQWEKIICENSYGSDYPRDVQLGFDTGGDRYISKRLQAERETMPDNSTLYQFNWMVRASNTNILYTVCVNTPVCDSYCMVLPGATDVAVQKGSSSSNFVAVYGPPGVDWVSICYKEAILDEDDEPSEEFGGLMAFAQPIVAENYVPGDAAMYSGDHSASGTSSTTVPNGAGTFGNQTV